MPTMHYIYSHLYGVGADRSVGVGKRLPGGIARGVFVAMYMIRSMVIQLSEVAISNAIWVASGWLPTSPSVAGLWRVPECCVLCATSTVLGGRGRRYCSFRHTIPRYLRSRDDDPCRGVCSLQASGIVRCTGNESACHVTGAIEEELKERQSFRKRSSRRCQ